MSRCFLRRSAVVLVTLFAAVIVVVADYGTGRSGSAVRPMASATTEIPEQVYVALGSSYAAGPNSDGPIERCQRSADNYPHQVAKALHMRLIDATCSGATTLNILDRPQRRLATTQIDAVTSDATLVTITTGGNDIDYIGRLVAMSCQTARNEHLHAELPHSCVLRRRISPEPTPADYEKAELTIAQTVLEVGLRAPRAKVVIVDYLPVVAAGGQSCSLLPLTPEQIAETSRIFDGLAAATARAAADTGALLIQASRAGASHSVCSSDPWLRGFRRPIPYHPNPAGKAGVARLIVDALGTHAP
ncbi:MAG: SGNH/GDSL hydrolase family protein [Gordonia sp. (in: high G+C Gram-positive bacteria)]